MMRTTGRSRRQFPWKTVFALLLLGALTGGVLLWQQQARELFWQAAAPVVALRNAAGSSNSQSLQEQLATARAAVADRDLLYEENLELKSRLGREVGVERILAAVLQHPPFVPYDTLTIDAGRTQGVAVGDQVSAGGTMIIGEVTQVFQSAARVSLFSAPGTEHQALLRGEVPVVVAGQGGGSFAADLPAGVLVSVGDAIVLPGIHPAFSGKVTHIDAREGESFMRLYFSLPMNPLELRYVEVWKQPSHEIQ